MTAEGVLILTCLVALLVAGVSLGVQLGALLYLLHTGDRPPAQPRAWLTKLRGEPRPWLTLAVAGMVAALAGAVVPAHMLQPAGVVVLTVGIAAHTVTSIRPLIRNGDVSGAVSE